MPAKASKVRFMTMGRGKVHVVTNKREDDKHSKCPSVKKGHVEGRWGRKTGISPDAALALDACVKCNTHEVAEAERRARMTPAQKRAESRAKANETRDRLKPKGNRPKRSPKGEDRSTRPSGGGMKRRGPKGTGDLNGKMKDKVEFHLEHAKKHGWRGKAWESGTNEWTCEVNRDGETLKIIYRDGRIVWARVVLKSGVEVRLRNSSKWLRHCEGKSGVKSDYEPKQQRGKRAAKQQVINDKAPRKLPFNLEVDDHDTIIESLLGKRITWRNSLSQTLETAVVPGRSRNCRIRVHPKSERMMISFYESQGLTKDGDQVRELLGGERTVYLDKILKAR